MNDHVRATGDPRPADPSPDPRHDLGHTSTEDELARRITRALRSREHLQPDAALVAASLAVELRAAAHRSPAGAVGRSGRLVVAGVVTSALAVGGAGAAAAANPYSDVARAVEGVAQAVGIEWSAMPDGYTREQYEAFWGAGYTVEDVEALGALWSTEPIETKARAGQMLLDGTPPPVVAHPAPAGTDDDAPALTTPEYTQEQYDAFWGAGYTAEDVAALNELWDSEFTETKARAGQMILDGQEPPIAPGEAGPADAG